MFVLMPTDQKNRDEATIVPMDDAVAWAIVEFEEGNIQAVKFFDSKEDVDEIIEYLIVAREGEDIWPFMEDGIFVLLAGEYRTIEEIMVAFKFRELHEASF